MSVLIGVVVTAITLCLTLFTVKDISVDFRTSISQDYEDKQIIEKSQIPYGKCLLFMSKDKFEENIEKEYPYLDVINIETVFPSKIVIHVAEREEIFAVQKNETTIYLDKDLKVLKIIEETYESDKNNLILLNGLQIDQINVGDFIKVNHNGIKNFYASMVENGKILAQIKGFVKQITLEKEFNSLLGEEQEHINIATFINRKIKILNADVNLNLKIQKMFQVVPMIYETLVDEGDYTPEEVQRCEILIGNQITNQNEIYVHVLLDGQIITQKNRD